MSFCLQLRPQLPLGRASCSFTRNARTLARPTRSEDDDDDEANALQLRRKASAPIAETWLTGDGRKFKDPKIGTNWLGGEVPFPLNPSFRPPPPLANSVRNKMYGLYMSDPEQYSIRALSSAYGISLKRVDAILRLKGLEKSWEKGKALQTGFLVGMESMLNVQKEMSAFPTDSHVCADKQDEEESSSRERDRYQRHFWEPVVEGESPIVAKALEQAKEEASEARSVARRAKSDPALLGRVKKPFKSAKPTPAVFYATRKDRPSTKFTDVGGKFLDTNDRVRRIHEAERRKNLRKGTRSTAV